MIPQQFLNRIRQLSIPDRVALIEEISHSLRVELTDNENGDLTATPDEKERKLVAVRRLRGALKFDGPPPTDEEVEAERFHYLTEKYS